MCRQGIHPAPASRRIESGGECAEEVGGKLLLQDHGQDVAFRHLRLRTIPASEIIKADPTFVPLPIPPAALAKEEARVRSMLEKKK